MGHVLGWLVNWLFGWLFALQRPYQKENEEKVTHALTHNIHHSFLHRLPLDILFYLTIYHISDPIDLLALRATTRALRFSPIIHPPPTLRQTSRDFIKRLRHDEFTRACDAENRERQRQQTAPPPPPPPAPPTPPLIPTWLLKTWRWATTHEPLHPCSGCEAQHPSSHFSATQLARAPESRRCKGSDGAVRVCPHLSFTLAEMRHIQEQGRTEPWVEPKGYTFQQECLKCPRRDGRHGEPGMKMLGLRWKWFRKNGFQRDFYPVHRWLPVGSLLVEGECSGGDGGIGSSEAARERTCFGFAPQLALRVLKAVDEREGGIFMCSHMRLGDPKTFKTESNALHGHQYPIISVHKCRFRSCDGRASLKWADSWSSEAYVELQIDRYLKFSSPNNKGWISQLEKLEE